MYHYYLGHIIFSVSLPLSRGINSNGRHTIFAFRAFFCKLDSARSRF